MELKMFPYLLFISEHFQKLSQHISSWDTLIYNHFHSKCIFFTKYVYFYICISVLFVYPTINILICILNYSFIYYLILVCQTTNSSQHILYTSHWDDHLWDAIQISDVGHLVYRFSYIIYSYIFCCCRHICFQLHRSCSVYSEPSCLYEQRNSSMSTRCQDRQDKRWWKQILQRATATCLSAVALSGGLMALRSTDSVLNKLLVAFQHSRVIKVKLNSSSVLMMVML